MTSHTIVTYLPCNYDANNAVDGKKQYKELIPGRIYCLELLSTAQEEVHDNFKPFIKNSLKWFTFVDGKQRYFKCFQLFVNYYVDLPEARHQKTITHGKQVKGLRHICYDHVNSLGNCMSRILRHVCHTLLVLSSAYSSTTMCTSKLMFSR